MTVVFGEVFKYLPVVFVTTLAETHTTLTARLDKFRYNSLPFSNCHAEKANMYM